MYQDRHCIRSSDKESVDHFALELRNPGLTARHGPSAGTVTGTRPWLPPALHAGSRPPGGTAGGSGRWLAQLWPGWRTREPARKISPAGQDAARRTAATPGPGGQRGLPGNRGITWWLKDRRDDRRRRLAGLAEARAHAPRQPGERLLAAARAADGGLAVATDRVLYHQEGRSPGTARVGTGGPGPLGRACRSEAARTGSAPPLVRALAGPSSPHVAGSGMALATAGGLLIYRDRQACPRREIVALPTS